MATTKLFTCLLTLISFGPLALGACEPEPEADDAEANASQACADFGMALAECYGDDADENEAFCLDYVDAFTKMEGEECGAAAADLFACAGALDCEQLKDDRACDAENSAFEDACDGIDTEGGDEDDDSANDLMTCADYGRRFAECYPDSSEDVETSCNEEIDRHEEDSGTSCAFAWEDFYDCLSILDCASWEADLPCPDEEETIEEVCEDERRGPWHEPKKLHPSDLGLSCPGAASALPGRM